MLAINANFETNQSEFIEVLIKMLVDKLIIHYRNEYKRLILENDSFVFRLRRDWKFTGTN